MVAEREAAVEDAMAIAVRYGEDPEEYRNPARMGFEITPRWVYGFG